ncbi:MAG: peptidoglycan DD-metalloendopeptidase family protein [Proteobacteria bacterium]|nr:peptidoglycan DD-metalloendopeptidase family protein [Pseudomonadota bacterium]
MRLVIVLTALAMAAPALAQEQQPNWAAGPGTPLSAWAMQPTQSDPREPPRSVRVARGQSLYDVAALYQIPMLALIEANGLEPPYSVSPGTVLRLPAPNIHVVREGERFDDIARAFNIDLHSLGTLNRMRPPYVVRPGDRIVLPAGARGDDTEEQYGPPAPAPASAETGRVPPPALTASRFGWPLRGEVVARYGAQANGARLDGIEIAGREGDPIAAAADGDVVYAGSDLAAYGTLVLIRHAGNYVTAYGFARRALVREGQQVRAGQAIAQLGSRPDGRARLLFQVRQGAHAVDPAPLLGFVPD